MGTMYPLMHITILLLTSVNCPPKKRDTGGVRLVGLLPGPKGMLHMGAFGCRGGRVLHIRVQKKGQPQARAGSG